MTFFSALFALSSTLSFTTPAPLDRCSDLIGSCEYYSCVDEERISCGDSGYPLGYGVNYCEKLSALEFNPARGGIKEKVFPADGNQWRDNVRSCLQVEMENYFANAGSSASCEELHDFAFDSHPRCYTELQPTSFCELPPEDVLKVGFTISPNDLLTQSSLRQIIDTALICENRLDERLSVEWNPLVRFELKKFRLLWKSVAENPAIVHLSGRSP